MAERPAKRTRMDFEDSVRVQVKQSSVAQARYFYIPRKLLLDRTTFFNNGNFFLPNVKPTTFSIYLELVYTKEVVLEDNSPDSHWIKIADLYELCKKLGDDKATKLVVKELAGMLKGNTNASYIIENAYAATTLGSVRRQVFVDCAVEHGLEAGIVNFACLNRMACGVQFLTAVACKLSEQRDQLRKDLAESAK